MKNKDILTISNNPPDITHLEERAKIYFYLLKNKQPKNEIAHVYTSLKNKFDKAAKNVPPVIFGDSLHIKHMFREDYLDDLNTALKISWGLGYDFGENNPQQARVLPLIISYDNDFLPEEIRQKVHALGDFAAMMSVNIVQYLHSLGFVSAADLINGSNATRMVHRDGVFTLFKKGINYFYTS